MVAWWSTHHHPVWELPACLICQKCQNHSLDQWQRVKTQGHMKEQTLKRRVIRFFYMHIMQYKLHKKIQWSTVIYKKSPWACFYILNYPHIHMNYDLSWEMVRWGNPMYCIIQGSGITITSPNHSKQYAFQCQFINTLKVAWNEKHQMLFHICHTCPSTQILWCWIDFITIHRQTTSPLLVNTSWSGHYDSVHLKFTHINQSDTWWK